LLHRWLPVGPPLVTRWFHRWLPVDDPLVFCCFTVGYPLMTRWSHRWFPTGFEVKSLFFN